MKYLLLLSIVFIFSCTPPKKDVVPIPEDPETEQTDTLNCPLELICEARDIPEDSLGIIVPFDWQPSSEIITFPIRIVMMNYYSDQERLHLAENTNDLIYHMNEKYAPAGIRFVADQFLEIPKDYYLEELLIDFNKEIDLNQFQDKTKIDLFVARNNEALQSKVGGFVLGYVYAFTQSELENKVVDTDWIFNRIVMSFEGMSKPAVASHEMGHFFSLDHTDGDCNLEEDNLFLRIMRPFFNDRMKCFTPSELRDIRYTAELRPSIHEKA